MAEIIKITDGNAFKLRITGEILLENYREAADMSVVSKLVVNFVRRGRLPQTASVDEQGRIVALNDGSLALGVYGVELTGYYNGEPWRYFSQDVFEIVDENSEANESTGDDVPMYDVTFVVSFGGDSITAAFVEAAISTHNNDEDSHPGITEELSKKVDDIMVDDESVVDVDPETGRRTVNLHKDQLGKVDDVLVNGESVLNEDNEAEITIPEKVSDLPNDADYATKQEAQQMVDDAKIDTVSVDYQEDGGAPDASASFEDGELAFSLKNMKMKFSDLTEADKAELKGEKGDQGDSAIFTGGGEPWSGLKNSTGQSTTEPMTQKAVTDALMDVDMDNLYWQGQATMPISGILTGNGTWYVNTGYTHAHFSADGIKYIKITGNALNGTLLGFLRTYTVPGEGDPNLIGEPISIGAGETKTLAVPDGCAYIVMQMNGGANSYVPQAVYVGRAINEHADSMAAKEGALRQRYAGCTLCLIGDSISTYQGDVPSDATYHYPAKGIMSLNMMYYKRLVDNLGFKSYQNLSYGGSGAVRYDQSSTHPSLFERISYVQAADVVIIALSANDCGHQVTIGTADYDIAIEDMGETTFYDAYIKGLKELMRKLPEAQVILMLTEETLDTDDTQLPIKMKDYHDAVREIAAHYGLAMIDASHAYSTYGYMVHGSGDIHPRSTEMELLYNSCIDNLLANQNEGGRKNRAKANEILTPIDFGIYQALDYYLFVDGLWTPNATITTAISKVIDIEPGKKYRLQATNTSPAVVNVLSNPNYGRYTAATFATGMTPKKAIVAQAGEYVEFISPDDGHYLYIGLKAASSGSVIDRTPQAIYRVDEVDLSAVKAAADNYFSKGGGAFRLGLANADNGTLNVTLAKLARTELIACAGLLNISVDVPDEMSVNGAFLLKYNDGEFVEAVELDYSELNYSIKVSGFTHAILRLTNTDGYTAAQWRTISYSYSTGMRYLIGSVESSSIEDMRIDYVRSIQTKTKVLEIEDNEMIPTTGTCITTHDGHLYVSIDGVKYEITKTQVQ